MIKNLYIRKAGDAGLFSAIGEGGSVKNVKASNFQFVYGEDLYQDHSHGIIAGVNAGTITKCTVQSSNMSGAIGTRQGGICGTNNGLVEACRAKSLKIMGSTYSNNDDCSARITAVNSGKIVDCESDTITARGWHAAGIAGDNAGGDITGCSTVGNCSFEAGWCTAAIAGYSSNGLFVDCYTETDYDLVAYNYSPRQG